jgi:hypothetical protein
VAGLGHGPEDAALMGLAVWGRGNLVAGIALIGGAPPVFWVISRRFAIYPRHRITLTGKAAVVKQPRSPVTVTRNQT